MITTIIIKGTPFGSTMLKNACWLSNSKVFNKSDGFLIVYESMNDAKLAMLNCVNHLTHCDYTRTTFKKPGDFKFVRGRRIDFSRFDSHAYINK